MRCKLSAERISEMFMIALGGFFMAMADSVPGVSGGTVAFIMGFYDDFIGSIERLFYGKAAEKKKAYKKWIYKKGLPKKAKVK